ncbi:tetratricopeptide repeat protein [Mucilaginibacter ginsenosidivorans]|uniref:Tetratricopeptide repeat protein n=1 Tax=Mucilaginibacter ginsenosidivorans TaxID=398053 RepID=A0A5B8V1D1_9SPHI|nr:tetratricopeptide repeat protein [Mucilaginibacter ginsenosidivorans]QEC64998.1 tetratricopeptide repeat protein [Mucilaginibacter ginsenosidivorans]
MRLSVISSLLVLSSLQAVYGQNAYFKMGQQAFFDGDFKAAVSHLERSCVIDSTNSSALWMLGYSYYHSENYKKSIAAYTRVIALKPADASAYYYRARAKSYFAKDSQMSDADKEKNLLGAIVDFTKAISIDPTDNQNNAKYYQNRGIAYREYGDFKLQAGSRFYDKVRGTNSLRASIADLEKVLNDNPGRQDIANQIEISKQRLTETIAARH